MLSKDFAVTINIQLLCCMLERFFLKKKAFSTYFSLSLKERFTNLLFCINTLPGQKKAPPN